MKYLFVGGPKDGERIELGEAPEYLQIAESAPLSLSVEESNFDRITIKTHTYRKERFCGGRSRTSSVYFHQSVPPDFSMDRLIEGYATSHQFRTLRGKLTELKKKSEEIAANEGLRYNEPLTLVSLTSCKYQTLNAALNHIRKSTRHANNTVLSLIVVNATGHLFKRRGSRFFQVGFKVEGELHRRSTGRSDEATASQVAKMWYLEISRRGKPSRVKIFADRKIIDANPSRL